MMGRKKKTMRALLRFDLNFKQKFDILFKPKLHCRKLKVQQLDQLILLSFILKTQKLFAYNLAYEKNFKKTSISPINSDF